MLRVRKKTESASGYWSLLITWSNLLVLMLEVNLSIQDCSPKNEFRCDSGQCINVWYKCDGDGDCEDASDERDCHTDLLTENFLIVADTERRNLFQVGIDDGKMVPILPIKVRRPIAVAYDQNNSDVYWTDVIQKSIAKYSLKDRSKTLTTIFRGSNDSLLDGLAVDSSRQMLYYCDAGDVGKIGLMQTDGQQHRVLIERVGMKPRSLVLDPSSRMMYWSDWGNQSSINRANMDKGSDRVVLISGGIMVWPNALAIDFTEKIMYWGDASLGMIQSARLDGTGRKLIYFNRGDHYFAFTLTPRYIYVTDWTERAVRKLDRRTMIMTDQQPAVFGRLVGIVYVGPTATGNTTRGDNVERAEAVQVVSTADYVEQEQDIESLQFRPLADEKTAEHNKTSSTTNQDSSQSNSFIAVIGGLLGALCVCVLFGFLIFTLAHRYRRSLSDGAYNGQREGRTSSADVTNRFYRDPDIMPIVDQDSCG